MIFICGSFANKRKCCKKCRNFLLWGISQGYCGKHKTDMNYGGYCKYYKRDSYAWTKDGICKIDESELYG